MHAYQPGAVLNPLHTFVFPIDYHSTTLFGEETEA